MPRPTIDVQGDEYQTLLRGRALYRRHGADYKKFMSAEDTLARLEQKLLLRDYTEKDRADFLIVKELYARAATKARPPNAPERHITTHYIWRTQQDSHVRPEHAANNGKIFAWDNPPPTGHPGGEFGCRCWAEPVPERLEEKKSQIVTFSAIDEKPEWTWQDLALHYRSGTGKDLTLHQIGLLQKVIHHARTYDQSELPGGGSIFERVENQLFEKARKNGAGQFVDPFSRGDYSFHEVMWALGHVPMNGSITASVIDRGDFLIIVANIGYNFVDYFRVETLNEEPEGGTTRDPRNRTVSPIGTKAFYIRDNWRTKIEAIIKKNVYESIYAPQ